MAALPFLIAIGRSISFGYFTIAVDQLFTRQVRIVEPGFPVFRFLRAHQFAWLQSQQLQDLFQLGRCRRCFQVLDDACLFALLFEQGKCGAGFTAAWIVVEGDVAGHGDACLPF